MLLLAVATPLLAQTPPVPDRTALPIPKPVTAAPTTPQEAADKLLASKALLQMMKPVWNDEQVGKIVFIGYHNAAAALCDDLEVDSAKMAKAVAHFDPPAKTSAARRQFLHDNLTLDIGLATGWVMAGNFRDVAGFCERARSDKAKMAPDKHLFDTSDDTPAAK